jgi:hypothetical protein
MAKSKDNLLTFDENSPLFVKKKSKRSPKKKQTKRARPVSKKKEVLNPNAPDYKIESPADCKHILPAFKKYLNAKWKLLTTGTAIQAGEVPHYIRGAATMIREKRPKEYEELLVLIMLARKISDERNKTEQEE